MGKKQASSSSSSKPKAEQAAAAAAAAAAAVTAEEVKKPIRNLNRIKNVKSGNAGNSKDAVPLNSTAARAQQAIDEGRPPPLFPVGYKTPITILNERCQKNGWQKPDLQPIKLPSGGGYSCIIRLSRQDPKAGLETVTFRPPTITSEPDDTSNNIALDKPTSIEAKHWGAVYALHRFCSGLQLSMVLPPQCRDYWSALQADKKEQLAATASSKNAGSKNAREKIELEYHEDPFEAARIQKSRLEAFKANSIAAAAGASEGALSSGAPSANNSGRNTPIGGFGLPKDTPEVKMSVEMRRMVQETIRKMREIQPPGPPPVMTALSNDTRHESSSASSSSAEEEPFILSKEEKINAVLDFPRS